MTEPESAEAKQVSAMAARWINEAVQVAQHGEYSAALVLAALVEISRLLLEHLPPSVRLKFLIAVGTGVVQDTRQ